MVFRTDLYRSEEHSVVHSLCAEELLAKSCGNGGCIFFAAEDVNVGCIFIVGEVSGEERGFDELCHRISCDTVIWTEVDDLRLAKAFHIDKVGKFENELVDIPNFQGNAAVNYTDRETPWTRIIEHKWFEFGKDENGNDLPKTVISREYSSEWKPGDEPYYPVNDEKNSALYQKYAELAAKEENVIFGGRLAEYKYYDMDAVIASALDCVEKKLR